MDLGEAIGIIKEKGKEVPREARNKALKALSINDGTCTDCGSYQLRVNGRYIHPFECSNTNRHDHNLTGFRKYLDAIRR